MVLYYKSTIVDPPAYIYVGKDKVESEAFHHHSYSRPAPRCMLTGLEMRT